MNKHVHKYERTELGKKGYEIYKCRLPDCPHYVPVAIATGRLSLCWANCGNAVMLTQEMVNHDKVWRPLCDTCKKLRAERRKAMRELPREEEIA